MKPAKHFIFLFICFVAFIILKCIVIIWFHVILLPIKSSVFHNEIYFIELLISR